MLNFAQILTRRRRSRHTAAATRASAAPAIDADRRSAAAPRAPVTVWEIDTADAPEYDRFVARAPHGLFYSLGWRDVLTQIGAGRPRYLLALSGDAPVGAFPLFETSAADGRRLTSLPATPVGGWLADDPAARAALLNRARALGGQREAAAIEIRHWERPADARRAPRAATWINTPRRACQQVIGSGAAGAMDFRTAPLAAADIALFSPAVRPLLDALRSAPFEVQCTLARGPQQQTTALAWLISHRLLLIAGVAAGPGLADVAQHAVLSEVLRIAARNEAHTAVMPGHTLPNATLARLFAVGAAEYSQDATL